MVPGSNFCSRVGASFKSKMGASFWVQNGGHFWVQNGCLFCPLFKTYRGGKFWAQNWGQFWAQNLGQFWAPESVVILRPKDQSWTAECVHFGGRPAVHQHFLEEARPCVSELVLGATFGLVPGVP